MGPPPDPSCEDPVDVLQWNGEPSGYIRCANGAILRLDQLECSVAPPDDEFCGGDGVCAFDADCDAMPGGQCEYNGIFGECVCLYPECATDEDCEPDQACYCHQYELPIPATCIPADCHTNDDCGEDFGCRYYDAAPDCKEMTLTCQGPEDECYADSDCNGWKCIYDDQAQSFYCDEADCNIGRPFLVAREVRVPAVARREDWRASIVPTLVQLTIAQRDELRECWLSTARMEYASVAAFARFTLQLLATGAPVDLVVETRRAMADELRHARLGYALASAYGGRDLGPGRLSIDDALSEHNFIATVETALLEGCVGETVAAIEAAELREHVVDPVVRGVLAGVARDEGRHAALAWRFLRWALARGGDEVRARAQATFERVAVELAGAPERALSAEDRWALRQGLVTDAARQTIRAAALREVVLPTRDALRRAA
ncbi:MAG: ferritin-like domain-containing protein [Myxococcales bacterium]|nr:ferritin-like domain-containing protein [Myxococcales bacterium]